MARVKRPSGGLLREAFEDGVHDAERRLERRVTEAKISKLTAVLANSHLKREITVLERDLAEAELSAAYSTFGMILYCVACGFLIGATLTLIVHWLG